MLDVWELTKKKIEKICRTRLDARWWIYSDILMPLRRRNGPTGLYCIQSRFYPEISIKGQVKILLIIFLNKNSDLNYQLIINSGI
jgi:hypothetical protein